MWKTLCKAWKFLNIYNFALVKITQMLIFDEITVLLRDSLLKLYTDIKSLLLFMLPRNDCFFLGCFAFGQNISSLLSLDLNKDREQKSFKYLLEQSLVSNHV